MNLLIDIGNTRIKSALSDGSTLAESNSIAWRKRNLNDTFEFLWAAEKPKRILVSNVGGAEIKNALIAWANVQWNLTPYFVKTESKAGDITCAYPNPEQLGIDRWVAVQAAGALCKGAVLVIDCGTATTIDLLTADRQHQGGAILPGIGTMRRALAGDTANLDVPEGEAKAFANNTQDAIAGGTLFALCGAIDRLAEEARSQFGEISEVLITGGEAELVRPLLKTTSQLVPDLVLLGLLAIDQRMLQINSD